MKRLVYNKNLLREKLLCSFLTIRVFCFAISMFLNHCNKLFASFYIIEYTTIINCCDGCMLFFFASHLHTHVFSLYKNNHTLGLKSIFDALFYFTSETLLHLKSMTKKYPLHVRSCLILLRVGWEYMPHAPFHRMEVGDVRTLKKNECL